MNKGQKNLENHASRPDYNEVVSWIYSHSTIPNQNQGVSPIKITITDDGKVNVHHSLTIKGANRLPYKFGIIDGDFSVRFCMMVSMVNMPDEVRGNLNFSHNKFKMLKGMPSKVDGHFDCGFNRGLILVGMGNIGLNVDVSYCDLYNLDGIQKHIKGDFFCNDNKLRGMKELEAVDGNCYCNNTLIADMSSIPQDKIAGSVDYSGNPVSPNDELDRSMWG